MVTEFPPQLLLLLSVGEGGRLVDAPLSQSRAADAGGRSLGAEPSASGHHVAVPPPHEYPLLGLGGWHGQVHPLVPPGRRGVVVRDLHSHRPGAAGKRGLLLRPHRCLRPRLCGRRHRVALHGRCRRQCRRNRRRRLRLRLPPCLCRDRRLMRLLHDRRPSLLSNRRLRLGRRGRQLWSRGLSCTLRTRARRRRFARPRPRRP
jgi:hypothetical protein